MQQGYSHIGFTTGEQQCERWWDMDGLKHLYDHNIPKCLNKLSAQFGCENSSTVIFTNKPCGKIRYIDREGWVIQYAKNDAASLPVKHKEVALFALEKRSEQVMAEVRALNISDALKQAMTAGEIPLFGW